MSRIRRDSKAGRRVLQVLPRDWDGTFSEPSYGVRPNRSAHQAVARAQTYIAAGYRGVVDIDLEKFFDRAGLRRCDTMAWGVTWPSKRLGVRTGRGI